MGVSVFPILIAPFPVLLQPVSNEFGWGRSTLSLAILLATAIATLLYPFVGRALDRWGSRAILVPGFLMFGLSICALSLIGRHEPQLYLLYILAGACGTLPTGVAFGRVITRAFDSNRGLVLGICLGVGGGVGAVIMPVYAHWLIATFGWRGAYIGLGLAPLAIGFPAALLLTREPRSGSKVVDTYGHWLGEALATYEYWVVIAGIFFVNVAVGGLFGHFVAIAGDLGVSSGKAASMVSAASLAMMAGQFVIGISLDFSRTPRLALVPFVGILGGAFCLQFAQSPSLLFAGILLVGLGSGSEYGLLPYVLTRLFGLRSFGQLYGIVYAASAVSYGIGPFVMGWTFDHLHSYQQAFVAFEAILALGMALLFAMKRYNYSPHGSRLHEPA